MAIWGDEAYLFNDGGLCRVLNLKTEIVIGEFMLASAGKNTHVNAACFGNINMNGEKTPVIYISEYNFPSRCFVERIDSLSSTLVQTIQAETNGKGQFVQSWILDDEAGCLYAIARQTASLGETNSKKVRISKYRRPNMDEGKYVVLTEKDCLDSFEVNFASGTQGGKIKDGYLYIVSGLQETAKGRFNAERAIQVVDLKKRKLVDVINLTYVTTNEPEDMDFYQDKALLYAGQNGGLYEVKLK